MKVAVVNPNHSLEGYTHISRCDKKVISATYWYPIHLAYLVSYLGKKGVDSILIDAEAEKLSEYETRKRIGDSNVVVMYIADRTINDFNSLSQRLREKGKKVIYVGPLTCNNPEKKLEYCDAVIKGEFDSAVFDLINGDESFNSVIEGKPVDMKEFGWVSKVYLKYLNVGNYNASFLSHPWVDMFTSRGCNWGKCTFCLWQWTLYRYNNKNTYRERDMEDVLDEIEWISSTGKIKEIFIEDDSLRYGRLQEMSEGILKRKKTKKILPISCYTRLGTPIDVLPLMKKAGFRTLDVGIESGCQEILDDINKGITTEQIETFIKEADKLGFFVHGDVMLGTSPLETPETVEKTISFVKTLPLKTVQFFTPIPYPETPFNRRMASKNCLTTKGEIKLPWASLEELEGLCSRATREYFFRPQYFVNVMKHPEHLKIIARSFKYVPAILFKNWKQ